MIKRETIVAEARAWIGTPFRHQGFTRAGCDCIGLVRGVGEATGALVLDPDEIRPFWRYPRNPRLKEIVRGADRFLVRQARDAARPGDLLCFDIGNGPQHFGILVEPGVIVHAHSGANRRGFEAAARETGRVVDSNIGPGLRIYPAAWRFPLVGL